MHQLLRHYLDSLGLSKSILPDEQQWLNFIEQINQSFMHSDQDKDCLQRSIDVSSLAMETFFQQQKESLESRQQSILNALPDLLFLIDEDGRQIEILAQNNSKLLYRPRHDALGKTMHEVLPRDIADQLLEVIQKALASNELHVINYQLDVAKGVTHFEGRVSATNQVVDDKRTVIFLSRDVTELVNAEKQKNLLNSVMKSSSEGLVVVNEAKKVMYANDAIARMTGVSVDDLLNTGEGFLRHELDQALCADICDEAHQNEHIQREIIIHKADSTEVCVLLNLTTLRNDKGEVEYFVGVLTDISALNRSKNELKFMATHDVLTGIPNRLLFEDRFAQSIAHARRIKKNGALLFLDIDGFKNINDTLGHRAGDTVLKEIANRLKAFCRAGDTVARFGGDEFVLIIENVETELRAGVFADKLLKRFADKINVQGYDLEITTSIGMTLFPVQGDDIEQLLRQADTAMYAAKSNGKNCYHMFIDSLLEEKVVTFNLDQDMRRALDNDEFFLLYQPQFCLNDHQLSGFEALIRWQHPQDGMVLPSQFIPAVEASGLIEQIGLWVFVKTCELVVKWENMGLEYKRISFNISQRQLINPNFADTLLNILHYTGAGQYARMIECEISENAIFKEGENAYNNLSKISRSGMQLAIDDFGTGHSSLANLKRFTFNRLKIDKSFIADVGQDSQDEAIIKATIALAQSFNLGVIAEGVENHQQEQFLKSVNCQEVQGFYYSSPVTAEEAELLLLKSKTQ